ILSPFPTRRSSDLASLLRKLSTIQYVSDALRFQSPAKPDSTTRPECTRPMTAEPASLRQRLLQLPMYVYFVLGTVLIIILLAALKPKPQLKPAADLVPFVSAIAAAPQALRPLVTLYGRVETPRESTLSSTVNGFAQTVLVEEGHTVAAGQALVQLDTSDVALILAQREAEVADME